MNRLEISVEKKAELLDFTRWSIGLEWTEIETFVNYLHVFKVEKGAPIFREGDQRPYMVILVKGEAEVSKQASSGGRKILSVIKIGQALGEMSIIDSQPRSATALATEETILLLLTQKSFSRLMQNHPGLGVKIYERIAKLLSQRLRQASGSLVDFLGQDGGSGETSAGAWVIQGVPDPIREQANREADSNHMTLGAWLTEVITAYSRAGGVSEIFPADSIPHPSELAAAVNLLNRRLAALEHRINSGQSKSTLLGGFGKMFKA